MKNSRLFVLLLGSGLFPFCCQASAMFAGNGDFTALSLEELANLEISTVSRKTEPLTSAAASVYVISADAIRQHGITTLPEALRLAPNLQVARSSASAWAITARGFNTTASNKLMVLVDGRPIYTPLYSGVWWDAHDVYLPDVERIEVISGPNATTWGSNAVNGVINIVTRDAATTQGVDASASVGDEDVYQVRYGGATAGGASYRVYGKHYAADATANGAGMSLEDDANRNRAGFRVDLDSKRSRFNVQGDVYDGEIDALATRLEISGGSLLANWQHDLAGDDVLQVSGYYDRTVRGNVTEGLESRIDVLGVNASHRLSLAEDHVIVWGSDIRHARDEVDNIPTAAFLPARRDLDWISLFVQDEWRPRESLSFIAGARAEDNEYTGVEVMPNLRAAWRPADRHAVWTSLSRSVRTPSRFDRDVYSPAEPPFIYAGGPDFDSEIADTFEIGYRVQPAADFSWSITGFHSDYDDLRTLQLNENGALEFVNGMQGTITGIESWWSWQVGRTWRIDGGLLLQDKDVDIAAGNLAVVPGEGDDPEQQWQLRSAWHIGERGALDLFLRHVGELPDPEVPAYTVLDARLAWSLTRRFDVALKVSNLLDEEHAEFGIDGLRPAFGRTVFLQLQWSPR